MMRILCDICDHRPMTRTTIDIAAPVLDELKRLQKKEGVSLGTVVSSLLAEALAERRKERDATQFHWKSRSMKSLVSVEDKEALWGVLDGRKERRRG